uniref:Uncharacterized protein n=1 Tax=Arundo donax TaxID=35708 RepID=A0A0A9FL91_ARUDO
MLTGTNCWLLTAYCETI